MGGRKGHYISMQIRFINDKFTEVIVNSQPTKHELHE